MQNKRLMRLLNKLTNWRKIENEMSKIGKYLGSTFSKHPLLSYCAIGACIFCVVLFGTNLVTYISNFEFGNNDDYSSENITAYNEERGELFPEDESVYDCEEEEYEDTLEIVADNSPSDNVVIAMELGLSVIWADRNVAAQSPTDYGMLIGWGTLDYHNNSKDLSEYPSSNPLQTISASCYDITKEKFGGEWRLPHLEELKELKDNCTWEVVSVDGQKVCKVTGPNGNYIYLPFAGYRDGTEVKREGTWGFLWSGDLYEGNSQYAANLTFSIEGKVSTSGFYRYGGESIRAVKDK